MRPWWLSTRILHLTTAVLDVAGYLPFGSTFTDVLSGTTFTVSPSGQISLPAVPRA